MPQNLNPSSIVAGLANSVPGEGHHMGQLIMGGNNGKKKDKKASPFKVGNIHQKMLEDNDEENYHNDVSSLAPYNPVEYNA